MSKNVKVFLGGTYEGYDWRKDLIKMMPDGVDYFNPVVDNWTEECRQIEETEKQESCNIHLYVITPHIAGVYSIAELMQSVLSRDKKVIFCIAGFNDKEFDSKMLNSLEAVGKLVEDNCEHCCSFAEIPLLLTFFRQQEKQCEKRYEK